MTDYVELQVLTHFSLLRGASSPEELFAAAALLGYSSIGVSDIGTVAGVVGDAAHATAPVWAQGAALALEDAIVLVRSIGEHPDIETALADYQHQRWKRVAHVQRLTDAMSKAAKLPNLIRNALIPVIAPRRYRQTYAPLKAEV
jgi:flavin-dependent dehydrogenase